MKISKYIAFLSIIIFTACEKEVNIPIEYTQSKIVVNALFNNDSLWDVEISASRYIYDQNPIPLINDAEVSITDQDGNIFSLINYGDGNYHSLTEKPQMNKEFTIEVKHDDYNDVTATNSLPGQMQVDDINWHEQVYVNGQMFRKINVDFQDSNEKDYYLVRLTGAYWEEVIDPLTGEPDTVLVNYPLYFFSENEAVEGLNSNSPQTSISFTDDIFNGNSYTIDLMIYEFYFGNGSGEGKLESIYVSVNKISEDYFWYHRSYQLYQSSNNNGPFSQPIQVYTNIKNGLGVFAGYSNTVDTINVN